MIVEETQEELEAMHLFVQDQKATGLEVTLLDGKQSRELEPSLSEGILGCTYSPLDGQVNPIALALAFLRRAREKGAKILPHTGMGFGLESDRMVSVKTAAGTIETKRVVNAAGVHAPGIGRMLGVEIPIKPRRGQCVCAHPYILHLLGLTPDESQVARQRILAGDRSDMPGMVRASFGLYNTLDEVDALVEALERISSGKYSGDYDQDISSGEYTPKGWKPDFRSYIPFLEDNLNLSG